MTLAGWLDAGEAFLLADTDSEAREIFTMLFSAEDKRSLDLGFQALEAEMQWRKGEAARAERERRKASKSPPRPKPTRRLGEDDLASLADEWNEFRKGAAE